MKRLETGATEINKANQAEVASYLKFDKYTISRLYGKWYSSHTVEDYTMKRVRKILGVEEINSLSRIVFSRVTSEHSPERDFTRNEH